MQGKRLRIRNIANNTYIKSSDRKINQLAFLNSVPYSCHIAIIYATIFIKIHLSEVPAYLLKV